MLSIIIPVLDEGEGIAESLDALSDLRSLGNEVIVVDGGSGDDNFVFEASGAAILIHGHTHRPAEHRLAVDGQPCERWVLADWREENGAASGEVLVWSGGTLQRQPLK